MAVLKRIVSVNPSFGPRTTESVPGSLIPRLCQPRTDITNTSVWPSTIKIHSPTSAASTASSMVSTTETSPILITQSFSNLNEFSLVSISDLSAIISITERMRKLFTIPLSTSPSTYNNSAPTSQALPNINGRITTSLHLRNMVR